MDYKKIINELENKRDKEILYSYYINEDNIKNICKKFQVSDRYLYKIIKINNLEKRKTTGMKTKETIENNKELLYYLIGLIGADGCMSEKRNRIEITLILSDIEILQKLSLLIYGKDRVLIDENCLPNGRCRLFIYGKETVELFKKYGITQAKTATLKFNLEFFESKYINHFVRGFMDGDGSYNVNGGRLKHNTIITLGGNLNVTTLMQDICSELGIKSSVFQINPYVSFDFYRFQISKNEDSLKFIQFAYKDANIYLERKYKKIKDKI